MTAGGRRRLEPRVWTKEELRVARDLAEVNYVAEEGPSDTRDAFVRVCMEMQPKVEHVLACTNDLLEVDPEIFTSDAEVWQLVRFFLGPPVSEENLWTFLGGSKFKGPVPQALASKLASVVLAGMDTGRFPWVAEARPATDSERSAAVLATAVLMAQQRFRTMRGVERSKKQESQVRAALGAAGFSYAPDAKTVDDLQPGTYCREKTLFNKKCDVPVRMRDGRLLTLECKVSNTPKNSWKRLNQETVGKSNTWREHLGNRVVTASVLAGVYDLASLVQAQEQGTTIFWEHDLSPLVTLIGSLAMSEEAS